MHACVKRTVTDIHTDFFPPWCIVSALFFPLSLSLSLLLLLFLISLFRCTSTRWLVTDDIESPSPTLMRWMVAWWFGWLGEPIGCLFPVFSCCIGQLCFCDEPWGVELDWRSLLWASTAAVWCSLHRLWLVRVVAARKSQQDASIAMQSIRIQEADISA